jgi:hypothetical protein
VLHYVGLLELNNQGYLPHLEVAKKIKGSEYGTRDQCYKNTTVSFHLNLRRKF